MTLQNSINNKVTTYSTVDGTLTLSGSGSVYTLSRVPQTDSLILAVDGQLQTAGGVDYTLTGAVIAFNTAPQSVGHITAICH